MNNKKYELKFFKLETGDLVIEGSGQIEKNISMFLENWNSIGDVEDLMEYLEVVLHSNTDHEDYKDLKDYGIFDNINGLLLFMEDDNIQIIIGEDKSDKIKLSDFIEIVKDWKKFIEEN